MVDKSWPLASCNFWKRLICLVQDPDTVNLTCATNVLSAVLRWSAGRKSFSAKTVVFRRKKSISSCRLASFSYCQLSLLAWSARTTISLVGSRHRSAWAQCPCHRRRTNPAKPEKGTQVLRPVPNMKNKCQELGFLASACSQRRAQSSVSVPRRLTTKVTVLTMGAKAGNKT